MAFRDVVGKPYESQTEKSTRPNQRPSRQPGPATKVGAGTVEVPQVLEHGAEVVAPDLLRISPRRVSLLW